MLKFLVLTMVLKQPYALKGQFGWNFKVIYYNYIFVFMVFQHHCLF